MNTKLKLLAKFQGITSVEILRTCFCVLVADLFQIDKLILLA
jgi:hypothetical protein